MMMMKNGHVEILSIQNTLFVRPQLCWTLVCRGRGAPMQSNQSGDKTNGLCPDCDEGGQTRSEIHYTYGGQKPDAACAAASAVSAVLWCHSVCP